MFSALGAVLKCHYIALKLEDKNSSLTLECENMHKAISDLSAEIENLYSSKKELQKNIKETTTT